MLTLPIWISERAGLEVTKKVPHSVTSGGVCETVTGIMIRRFGSAWTCGPVCWIDPLPLALIEIEKFAALT